MEQKEKRKQVLALALGIAALPPLWAVMAPYIGVTTGAAALICAGLFSASGNKYKDIPRMCAGFLLGDLWAVAALKLLDVMHFNPDVELYVTLFVMGGLAVLISFCVEKFIYLPAWLCGWAIGLTIMGPAGYIGIGSLPIQIGVSMLVGVIYVGAGVDLFQKFLTNARKGHGEQVKELS